MTQFNSLAAVKDALKRAWNEDKGVEQFKLSILEEQIRPAGGGFAVPVASGTETGSASDLARTLSHLQDLAETYSGQSLTLYLDPFAPRKN